MHVIEEIGGVLVIVVCTEVDSVVKYSELDSEVELLGSLPEEVLIRHCSTSDGSISVVDVSCIVVTLSIVDTDVVITCETVADACLKVIKPVNILHERLFSHYPSS